MRHPVYACDASPSSSRARGVERATTYRAYAGPSLYAAVSRHYVVESDCPARDNDA